jgi:hypothetical protein
MALNLGTPAMEAAHDLAKGKGEDVRALFEKVREGVYAAVRKQMNDALDVGPDDRHMAVGYARALRDVYLALESAATNGVGPVRAENPTPVSKHVAAR